MAYLEGEGIRLYEYLDDITSVATSWSRLVERELLDKYTWRLAEIVHAYPHRYLPESHIKIFVDNNGIIGLAPADTLLGDTIWEVDNSNPLRIARKTAEGYEVVARSTKYIALPELNEESWIELLPLLHRHLAFVSLPEE
jgi:hypothetical protein